MEDSKKLYLEFFDLTREQVKTAGLEEILPWLAGAGLLGAGVGVPLAYKLGRRGHDDDEVLNRGVSFGAGALSGLIAPRLIHSLRNVAGLTDLPGGETDFTEI